LLLQGFPAVAAAALRPLLLLHLQLAPAVQVALARHLQFLAGLLLMRAAAVVAGIHAFQTMLAAQAVLAAVVMEAQILVIAMALLARQIQAAVAVRVVM
jgi:hypothetical protein